MKKLLISIYKILYSLLVIITTFSYPEFLSPKIVETHVKLTGNENFRFYVVSNYKAVVGV